MTPLQRDLYALITSHFGNPQFLRYANVNRISRAKIIKDMDYALTQWALDITDGNQVKAAKLLTLNRNTLKSTMQRNDIKTRKSAVAEFMDALGIK